MKGKSDIRNGERAISKFFEYIKRFTEKMQMQESDEEEKGIGGSIDEMVRKDIVRSAESRICVRGKAEKDRELP